MTYEPLRDVTQALAQCEAVLRDDEENRKAQRVRDALRDDFQITVDVPPVTKASMEHVAATLESGFHACCAERYFEIAHKFNRALTLATLVEA